MAEEEPGSAGSTEPTPDAPAVERPAFEVVRRGFSQEQVLQYVQRESERVQELELRLATAIGELAEARQALETAGAAARDPLDGVSAHVMDLVRGFDRETERQRRMVDLETTGMLAEARTEAARMRMDAQAESDRARGQAERLVREAEEEAARIREELGALRTTTLDRVRQTRERLRASLAELDAALPEEAGAAEEGEEAGAVIVLGEAPERVAPPPPRPGIPPSV
jgi:hypothetical protein